MSGISSFFSGLRGKLILTYTTVTVLALMALEVLILLGLWAVSAYFQTDLRGYLNDVVYYLYPQASEYLQPGQIDAPGLQAWVEEVAKSGNASPGPMNAFDSPAARIVPGDPLRVLAADGTVLAQTPLESGNQVGRRYIATADGSEQMLAQALQGNQDVLRLSERTPAGHYRIAVPVHQSDRDSRVVGVVLLTIEPPPPMILSTWPVYVGWVLGTGLVLLLAVAPFGALFGLIMSRGLTGRLTRLAQAADAWSEGNFRPMPEDRSRDEIGALAMRLRRMAERIQNLLHTQQELAVLEERNRLARELHDTVKQQNFATLMQVRAARNLIASDPAEAGKRLADAEELIKLSQEELGRMIGEMRPAALEGQGLSNALRAYLETWSEHTRILSNLRVTGERRLPLATEQALYRVAQEALSNVARHSRASTAGLRLEILPAEVKLEISDNGVGFDTGAQDGRGFGLESMRARLTELGGRLDIESNPEDGTRITARAPVQ